MTTMTTIASAAARSLYFCVVVLLLTTMGRSGSALVSAAAPPVVLDFYIMAKCPDAEACVTTFYPALHPLIDIVDVRVNYIAKQLAPGSFSCMHGPTECEGSIDQLCVQHLYPKNLTWLDYLNCEEETRTSIPTNGPVCAAQLGLSQPAIDLCHTSVGDWLFNESIARTDAAQEVVSCTMNLNDVFWCQHNGDWVNCTEGTDVPSLTKAICTRYQGANKPAACSTFGVVAEDEDGEAVDAAPVAVAVEEEHVADEIKKPLLKVANFKHTTLMFTKD